MKTAIKTILQDQIEALIFIDIKSCDDLEGRAEGQQCHAGEWPLPDRGGNGSGLTFFIKLNRGPSGCGAHSRPPLTTP